MNTIKLNFWIIDLMIQKIYIKVFKTFTIVLSSSIKYLANLSDRLNFTKTVELNLELKMALKLLSLSNNLMLNSAFPLIFILSCTKKLNILTIKIIFNYH